MSDAYVICKALNYDTNTNIQKNWFYWIYSI
jgi:hypothetical protein